MKTQFILALFSLMAVSSFAQNFAPQGYTYQAIARNPQGNPIASQSIPVTISIISGTPNGPLQYKENHSPTTNAYGLFTVTVGQGTQNGGAVSFPNINWGSGAHYMKVECDFGSGLENMGITQIWSVPYSLYARRAYVADSIAGLNVGFPSGIIVMWSGSPSNIPNGWALCNGSNGTPDLTGRFIVGYDPNDPDYNAIGNTGGSAVDNATHQVTIDPPAQNFTTTNPVGVDGVGSLSASPGDAAEILHTHAVSVDISPITVTSGPPSNTENRPPYYTLAYIIKL